VVGFSPEIVTRAKAIANGLVRTGCASEPRISHGTGRGLVATAAAPM
jgi:hypothetical protein